MAQFFFLSILSGNIDVFNKSPGSTSNASALLNNISKENGLTRFGASIALR